MGKNGASQVWDKERREDSELNIKKKKIINKAVEGQGGRSVLGRLGFVIGIVYKWAGKFYKPDDGNFYEKFLHVIHVEKKFVKCRISAQGLKILVSCLKIYKLKENINLSLRHLNLDQCLILIYCD